MNGFEMDGERFRKAVPDERPARGFHPRAEVYHKESCVLSSG